MESTNGHSVRWYALHVHPRFEKAVFRDLEAKGYEAFLPLARHRRHGPHRVKEITTPLFPSYVFCRFSAVHRPAILAVPGVNCGSGLGDMPLPVDERELDDVRRLLDSGLPCQPWPFVAKGEAVSVERGSLSGLEGIVTTVRGEHRLVIPVTVLRCAVGVKIDPDDIRPILDPRKARIPHRTPSRTRRAGTSSSGTPATSTAARWISSKGFASRLRSSSWRI